MRFVRYVGSGANASQGYAEALDAADTATIDSLPGAPNVTVSFRLDGSPLEIDLDDDARDFLDLSLTVYVADELLSRSHSIDRWTRQFDLLFPVCQPDQWQSHTHLLQSVLRILSGDEYKIAWCNRGPLPSPERHRTHLPQGFDTVCLFSGGLDSLCGAYRLLSQGRRVLLVGHQAEGITSLAQTELASALCRLFPSSVSLVQSRIARSPRRSPRFRLPTKAENSHRVRSFLFLALGVSIACTMGIREVVIPENGLIALNPPLQISRIGTLSTRTAHPAFLLGYTELVRAIGVYNGRIWNPFLYDSKTDVLQSPDARLRDLVLRSVSCAHAGDVRWTGSRARHCGYCVPCIYRRIAMLEAGIDHRDHYAFDVFAKLPALSARRQADFRALYAFAHKCASASPSTRQMMVLSHGTFPATAGAQIGPREVTDYTAWSDMLLRWSQGFLRWTDRLCSPDTKRIICT